MAKDAHIKVGSAWKAIDNVKIKVSSAWKQVDQIWVKQGGVWRESWINGVFSAPATQLFRAECLINGSGIDGDLTILNSGVIQWVGDNFGYSANVDWWTPNNTVQGTWHARLEYVSGTNFYQSIGSENLNQWYAISTSPHWGFFENGYGSSGGSQDGVYSLKFSDDAGVSTHHTCTVTVRMIEPTI